MTKSSSLKISSESPVSAIEILNEVGETCLELFKGTKKIHYGLQDNSYILDFTKAVPKQEGLETRVRKPLMRYKVDSSVSSEGSDFEITVYRGVTKILSNACSDKKKLKGIIKETIIAILEDAGAQAQYYRTLASEAVAQDIAELAKNEDFQGIFTNIPDHGYHKCPGISKSQLTYIQKTYNHFKYHMEKSNEETESMKLGSVLHLKVLEPQRYKSEVIVMDLDKRSSEGKIQALLNEIMYAGLYVISSEQEQKVLAMEANIKKHPVIPSLIEESQFESSIFWKNELGSLSRGRMDGLIQEPSKKLAKILSESTPLTEEQILGASIIWDLKTTDSAHEEDFSRKIYDMDYHVQAAYYANGLKSLNGRPVIFIFVAVESSGPHQCDYHILDDASLELGERSYMKWLCKLDGHQKNPKLWGGYSLKKGFMALPRYAFSKEEV